MSKLTCPECGAPMRLRYARRLRYRDGTPRRFYGCSRYPECTCAHGAHPDGTPLGVPADAETRRARQAAHDAFFRHQEKYGLSRGEAYAWLRRMLSMSPKECHIAQFDRETCELVVGLCNQGRVVEG